ncbi:hypothetical protein [Nostoc sp. PCC 7524]
MGLVQLSGNQVEPHYHLYCQYFSAHLGTDLAGAV